MDAHPIIPYHAFFDLLNLPCPNLPTNWRSPKVWQGHRVQAPSPRVLCRRHRHCCYLGAPDSSPVMDQNRRPIHSTTVPKGIHMPWLRNVENVSGASCAWVPLKICSQILGMLHSNIFNRNRDDLKFPPRNKMMPKTNRSLEDHFPLYEGWFSGSNSLLEGWHYLQ